MKIHASLGWLMLAGLACSSENPPSALSPRTNSFSPRIAGAPVSLDTYVAEYPSVICRRLATCCSAIVQSPGQYDSCLAGLKNLLQSSRSDVEAGKKKFLPDYAGMCLATFKAIPDDGQHYCYQEIEPGLPPFDCLFGPFVLDQQGSVPVGNACLTFNDCEGGDTGSAVCESICKRVLRAGENCTTPGAISRCDTGLRCDMEGSGQCVEDILCTPQSCAPPSSCRADGTCSLGTGTQGKSCLHEDDCAPPLLCLQGTCNAYTASGAACFAGSPPCSPDHECVPLASCLQDTDGDGKPDNTEACIKHCSPRASCAGDEQCTEGNFCSAAHACSPRRGEGSGCTLPEECASKTCLAGRCVPAMLESIVQICLASASP